MGSDWFYSKFRMVFECIRRETLNSSRTYRNLTPHLNSPNLLSFCYPKIDLPLMCITGCPVLLDRKDIGVGKYNENFYCDTTLSIPRTLSFAP